MQKKNVINGSYLKSSLMFNPFDRLKGLVNCKDIPHSRPFHPESTSKKETSSNPQPDEQLFLEAMAGVNPITKNQAVGGNAEVKPEEKSRYVFEDETLSRLVRLVDHGEGFIVSDTPEYIEGTGYNVHREVARRLHRGDFSIQSHIDLHGMNVEQAKEAFELFMTDSYNSGKRAVLIIHGRGLSSPGEPVLKNKVREWFSQSYWLKRIIAYASAQSYDGGAGATYVLLRSRPASKGSRERN